MLFSVRTLALHIFNYLFGEVFKKLEADTNSIQIVYVVLELFSVINSSEAGMPKIRLAGRVRPSGYFNTVRPRHQNLSMLTD